MVTSAYRLCPSHQRNESLEVESRSNEDEEVIILAGDENTIEAKSPFGLFFITFWIKETRSNPFFIREELALSCPFSFVAPY